MCFISNTVPNNSMLPENEQQNIPKTVLSLNKEADRLKTFNSWTKKKIDKHHLAKYGFYYVGPEDAVKCIYCDVTIASWDVGDDPLREHIHWSPSCPLLLHNASDNVAVEPNFHTQLLSRKFVVPIVYNDETTYNHIDTISSNRLTHEIKLTGEAAVRHPAYCTEEKRLKSFRNWPKSLKTSPVSLSEAGLFYLGKGDQVKCFYCGGALRDFEDNDEPWIEHAKYFDCDFVKKNKGEQFIEQARRTLEENDFDDDMDMESLSNNEDDDENIFTKCNICLSEELDTIFLPCMHIYTCAKCGFSFKNCPVCRQKITELKKCNFG